MDTVMCARMGVQHTPDIDVSSTTALSNIDNIHKRGKHYKAVNQLTSQSSFPAFQANRLSLPVVFPKVCHAITEGPCADVVGQFGIHFNSRFNS